jgi:hypothetical protein
MRLFTGMVPVSTAITRSTRTWMLLRLVSIDLSADVGRAGKQKKPEG